MTRKEDKAELIYKEESYAANWVSWSTLAIIQDWNTSASCLEAMNPPISTSENFRVFSCV